MQKYRNPHTIANEIRMSRTQFEGTYLIVEGSTDALFYKSVMDSACCQPIVATSKANVIETLNILDDNHFAGVLAIVDADFNTMDKTTASSPNLLMTDTHDLETMLLKSSALDKILVEFASDEKLVRLVTSTGRTVRGVLLEQCMSIGYLRLLSLNGGLNLKFEGLEFGKFTDKKTLKVDEPKLVEAVKNISKRNDLSSSELLAQVSELRGKGDDPWCVVCGHDLTTMLSFGLKTALGTHNTNEVAPDILERALRLAYDISQFRSTQLYQSIHNWELMNSQFTVLR